MNKDPAPNVETPSGKDAAYENFPVGSWLLPAKLRPHIAVFYRFARTIDDIADSPHLEPAEKVRRLEGFATVVASGGGGGGDDNDSTCAYKAGVRMRQSLDQTKTSPRHCLDLIDAFKQDAIKNRYSDWDDLMAYCVRSAAPVGRYLLDLHGGAADGYGASDALCNALQVINHLQDCKDDYASLNRVYLPGAWINDEDMQIGALAADHETPELRRVVDRVLDATEVLMEDAWRLPGGVKNRRLAMESTAILRIAERLIQRLRREDVLGARVELSKAGYLWQCFLGAAPVALGVRPKRRPV